MIRAALLAVALVACNTPPPSAAPVGNRSTSAPPDAAPPDDASTCVPDCVRDRRMQALSLAAITAQCERDCALIDL